MTEEDILVVTTFVDGHISSTRAYPVGVDPVRLAIGYVLDEAGPGNASIHTKVKRYFNSGSDAAFENIRVQIRRVPFFQELSEADSHKAAIDKLAAAVPVYKPQEVH